MPASLAGLLNGLQSFACRVLLTLTTFAATPLIGSVSWPTPLRQGRIGLPWPVTIQGFLLASRARLTRTAIGSQYRNVASLVTCVAFYAHEFPSAPGAGDAWPTPPLWRTDRTSLTALAI
jgi:hypothetical protein